MTLVQSSILLFGLSISSLYQPGFSPLSLCGTQYSATIGIAINPSFSIVRTNTQSSSIPSFSILKYSLMGNHPCNFIRSINKLATSAPIIFSCILSFITIHPLLRMECHRQMYNNQIILKSSNPQMNLT